MKTQVKGKGIQSYFVSILICASNTNKNNKENGYCPFNNRKSFVMKVLREIYDVTAYILRIVMGKIKFNSI